MKTNIIDSQITFHTPTINDMNWYKDIISKEEQINCDYCFGNVFMWGNCSYREIAMFDNGVISKFKTKNNPIYFFPIGCTDTKKAIDYIIDDSNKLNSPLFIISLNEEQMKFLDTNFPNKFLFEESRDYEDYVYDIEKLSSYSGKKLHSKKNHCNRFSSEYDWSFEPLTEDKTNDCINMLDMWIEENKSRLSNDIIIEKNAILYGFNNYKELNLKGGILKVSDEIIAFSVGEKISHDTYDIHFEKAYTSYNGAYSMICREFSKYIKTIDPDIKYLNREDDMGNVYLRKSKESYQPEFMIKKYTARYTNNEN